MKSRRSWNSWPARASFVTGEDIRVDGGPRAALAATIPHDHGDVKEMNDNRRDIHGDISLIRIMC
jgi:hypothetical protein